MFNLGDLPDYHTYIVPAPDIPDIEIGPSLVAEYDSTPEAIPDGEKGPLLINQYGKLWALIDHMKIKGSDLKDPTISLSVPISVENPAIAYNAATDRFKVDVEALTDNDMDMIDRAARLLGIIYGSQGQQILQRATTYDLIVQLRHSGAEIDPRAIRALTSGDAVSVYGSQTQKLVQRATTYDLLAQLRHAGAEIDPRAIRALTASDVVTIQEPLSIDDNGGSITVDGSLTVSATDLDIRNLSKTLDEIYVVLKTDAGAAYDARDVSDRAARLLGVIYGSQAQQILQRATTYDLLAQLRHNGAEIDPRSIRALVNTDVVTGEISKWGGTSLTGRDISLDTKAIVDDSIKGHLRSLGDAGATPTNVTGETVLKKLDTIQSKLDELEDALDSVGTDYLRVLGKTGDPLFGIESVVGDKKSSMDVAAGNHTLSSDTVGSGKFWDITFLQAYDTTTVITQIELYVVHDGTYINIGILTSPTTSLGFQWNGHVYLDVDDYVHAIFVGCALHDNIYFSYNGYQMDA